MPGIRIIVLLVLGAVGAGNAQAQYPERFVKLVVPFLPGSGPDTVARSISEPLSGRLGRQVIIENRPGAGGNIGAEQAAHAIADGYTLMLGTSSHATNPALYSRAGYDLARDFEAIALVVKLPSLLVVPPKVPVQDVKELVALAKAKPGELTFASGGNGSLAHLSGAAFLSFAKIEAVHVPYRGAPDIIMSLLSGQAQFAFPTFGNALPLVRSGKLHALAVTGEKRNPQLPNVPTMTEALPPGFVIEAWFGLFAPVGTSPEIVKFLNANVNAVLAEPKLRDKLLSEGNDVVTMSPEETRDYVKNEVAKGTWLVKEVGAKLE